MARPSSRFYRDWLRHDPRRIHLAAATRCAVSIALIVAAGVWAGQRAIAAVACGGAFTVGSGVYQRLGRSQIAPMVAATLGMGLSATAGTLAGWSPVSLALAVAVWGLAAGMMPALSGGGQWIGQQCAIALLVASSFPGTITAAASRGLLVMSGGVIQILVVETLLRFGDVRTELKGWPETRRDLRAALTTLRAAAAPGSPNLGFAVGVAITLVAAALTERIIGLPNGYWVAMTALLLLRMDFHATWHRSASRVGGTLLGGGAAMLAVRAGLPDWALAALVPSTAFLCFAFQQFSYAVFSVFLTGYIVLLLSYGGLHGQIVADNRILGTLLGAGFALAGHVGFRLARRRQTCSACPSPPNAAS